MKVHVYKDSAYHGTSGRGNSYIRQTMYFSMPNRPVPERVEVFVDEEYPVGEYECNLENSLDVRENKLVIGKLEMTPVKPVQTSTLKTG